MTGDIAGLEKKLKTKPESYFLNRGERMALALFHDMARRVPAYRDFLKKHRVRHESVKTMEDFSRIPAIDKQNYLNAYPRKLLVWDGAFSSSRWTIATTSGSTGKPFYFPRTEEQDLVYAKTAELYLRENFRIQDHSVLYIDGFAMGAWIGGVFTYQAIRHLAARGKYRLSIITPGVFKSEIIEAVRNLGHDFDMVVIGGYPPLIKDTIDQGIEEGLHWKKYNLRFVFSAEGFSESFRDYIIAKTGLMNPYTDTLNHYGTVDLGTMAHETPLSVLIRRSVSTDCDVCFTVFGSRHHQPTLAQYMPEDFYFESDNGNLFCTARSGIPLVRYDLKDIGGVYTKAELSDTLKRCGIDLAQAVAAAKIGNTVWNLPFVYIHERSDFIVKLYGANIYPATIRKVLGSVPNQRDLSGKFTLKIMYDERETQYLSVDVEMKKAKKPAVRLSERLSREITEQLLLENSEYQSNYRESPDRQTPRVRLWEYGKPPYFAGGGKHKWVR
jgi:phenylacetate-CoA ligase